MPKSLAQHRESNPGVAEIIFDHKESEKSTEDELPVVDIKLEPVDSGGSDSGDVSGGSVATEESHIEEEVEATSIVTRECTVSLFRIPHEWTQPCRRVVKRKRIADHSIPSSPPLPIEQNTKRQRLSSVAGSFPTGSQLSPPVAAKPPTLRIEELLTKISDSEVNGSGADEESLIEEEVEASPVLTEECSVPLTPSKTSQNWVKPYQRLVKRKSKVGRSIPSETEPPLPPSDLKRTQNSEDNGSVAAEESLIEEEVEASSVLTEECSIPLIPSSDPQNLVKPYQRFVKRKSKVSSGSLHSPPAPESPLPRDEVIQTKGETLPQDNEEDFGAKGSLPHVFYCYNCDFATKCRKQLRNHVIKHLTRKRAHCCKLCSYKSWSRKYLEEHSALHTGKRKLSCGACEFKTLFKYRLVDHERTHNQEKSYECNLCPFRSKSVKYLRVHMNFHNSINVFKCTYCSFSAVQSHALKKHVAIHTGEKNHACTQCGFRTNRASTLRDHVRYKHENIKKIKCPHCAYRTGHRGNMKSHIRTHTDERPYACAECPFKARTSKVLENHRMTHTGERPFACDQCAYRSAQEGPMILHVNSVHFKLAPFECHHCKYRTSRLCVLRKHINNHFGLLVKTACDFPGCSYSTPYKTLLKEHKRVHTGEKSFACPKCTRRCTTARLLKRHLKVHLKPRKNQPIGLEIITSV